ncbi:antitoxin [Mycobacterium sp. 236(2023)]|uniref:antitoxin n=1 Tax=Mycobacterium sp. 236(2023) TaxID=3038163 RepID=UPI0024156123|nr:antitoxin [Mycobacterium sp. 236(2023)]MDG4665704.1 antitoxin [Mycobacterium sp. 236(2023)]
MGFLDKAKDLLSKNADKVDTVINKAGDLVDKKTQGKYASTVDKVQEAAKKAVADQRNQGPQVSPDQQSGQVPPASPPPTTPPPPATPPPPPPPQAPPTAPPTS